MFKHALQNIYLNRANKIQMSFIFIHTSSYYKQQASYFKESSLPACGTLKNLLCTAENCTAG